MNILRLSLNVHVKFLKNITKILQVSLTFAKKKYIIIG